MANISRSHMSGHSKGTKGTMESPHRPRAGKRSTYSEKPVNLVGGKGTKDEPRVTIGDDAGGM